MNNSVDDRRLAAPMARREEGAYSPYVPRSNAGSGHGSAPTTIELSVRGPLAMRSLVSLATLALAAVTLLARWAHADQYEAQWSVRPLAGLAEVRQDGAAQSQRARIAGAALGVSYGVSDRLDLGLELWTLAAATTTFADTTLTVDRGNIVTGAFTRRSGSSLLLLGPTWRLGVAWVPVLTLAAGAGVRYRGDGGFRQLEVFPAAADRSVALDLAAMARIGLEHRVHRRITLGAYGAALASWGPSLPRFAHASVSIGISYVYYPLR
jgi:hypothetical protein